MFLTTDTEVQLKESENNDYNRIIAHWMFVLFWVITIIETV